jgi:DNA polymerase I-like protein with 3'-5' exonuclease and polymerase domains
MKYLSQHFKHAIVEDFEFHHGDNPGNVPVPVCVVAHDLITGDEYNVWLDGVKAPSIPYPCGDDTLFISYYTGAEINCHLALNWPTPGNNIDLYAEFRTLHNGRYFSINDPKKKWGLTSALTYYGLSSMGSDRKDSMRDRILQGPPYSQHERDQILEYCAADVDGTVQLFEKMLPSIQIPYALMRGEFSANCARIEYAGIPIDMDIFNLLNDNWHDIQLHLIREVDKDFKIYEGTVFKERNFLKYLIKNNIPWPRTRTGKPRTDGDTFKEMSQTYPQLTPLKELKHTTGQIKLKKLQVGNDGRNRTLLSPFGTITGRCAPSTAKYVFGPAKWMRSLIKPGPDMALAYLDWSQQEYAIAAALSDDKQMQESYQSGDPYLTFAKLAKAVPQDATKESHPKERSLYKACVLAIAYGMGPKAFAHRINKPESVARRLLRQHKQAYPTFWKWSDQVVTYASTRGTLETVLGWRYQWPFNKRPGQEPNPRQLRNWPMQSNGAEMLRIAVHEILTKGVSIVALVHDAIMIEAPIKDIDNAVEICKKSMLRASRMLLNGFTVGVDAEIVKYPDRYIDEHGKHMWNIVMEILTEKVCGFVTSY